MRTNRMRSAGRRGIALLLLISWLAVSALPGAAAISRPPALPAAPATPAASQAASRVYLPLLATPGPGPSAQELIAQALAEGRIDYGTSLLYRAYALFSDARLPRDLWGAYAEGEDPGLFAEARDPTLPAATQAALRPFLVRPDHPDSVFNARPGAARSNALVCDAKNWTALGSTQAGVRARVHVECTGDYEADLVNTLALIESLWDPMVELMGQPILDTGGPDGGGSTDIDLYLVRPVNTIIRQGQAQQIRAGTVAVAPSAAPYQGGRSSGYMLLGRNDLGSAGFKSTLAHEFFHILQNAHNQAIAFNNNWAEWWFVEASATWAESYFVPESSRNEVHVRFSNTFQPGDEPLHLSVRTDDPWRNHMYAAYIWPFFMQQERGPQAIAAAWRAIAVAGTDWSRGNAAIDSQLPFAEHFRRFALRNLNTALLPGDPISPRYSHLAYPGSFPENVLPTMSMVETLNAESADAPAIAYESRLPPLKAHYYQLFFTESVKQVELDLSALAQAGNLNVDALVKVRNKGWELRQLSGRSKAELCDVEELYLVISNHASAMSQTTPALFGVRPLAAECACSDVALIQAWTGTVSFSYSQSADDGNDSIVHQNSGEVQSRITNNGRGGLATASGTVSASYTHHVYTNLGKELFYSYSGNGAPVPYRSVDAGSRMSLSFDLEQCTYNFYIGLDLVVSTNDGQQKEHRVTNIGSANRPLSDAGFTLSGSAAFPAHSDVYILENGGDWYDQPDDRMQQILGEDKMGYAQVTWSFTPAEPAGQ